MSLNDFLPDMPFYVPAIGVALTLVGFIYLGLSNYDNKEESKNALDRLDDYEVRMPQSEREKALTKSLGQRFADTATAKLGALVRRFTPTGYIDGMKEKLLLTGKSGPDTVERFLAVRVITAALILPGFFLGLQLADGAKGFICAALIGLALGLGPDAVVNRRVGERQSIIRNSLPDLLDLLTISVEAGLGFEQALVRTVDQVPGPLSDEFRRLLAEVRTGSSRAESLRSWIAVRALKRSAHSYWQFCRLIRLVCRLRACCAFRAKKCALSVANSHRKRHKRRQ